MSLNIHSDQNVFNLTELFTSSADQLHANLIQWMYN